MLPISWNSSASNAPTVEKSRRCCAAIRAVSRLISCCSRSKGGWMLFLCTGFASGRWLQSQFLHHHLKILPGFLLLARIAQEKGRVIGDSQLGAGPVRVVAAHASGTEVIPATAEVRHRLVESKQSLGRDRTQGDDHLRLDGGYLTHQERRTGLALVALRRSVVGRTALDDVGDVNVATIETHGLDHVVE